MWTDFTHFFSTTVFFTLAVFGILIFITIYLYRTSEFFSFKKLKISILILTFLEVAVLILFFIFQKSPQNKLRIAIFPFQYQGTGEQNEWLAWGLSDLTEYAIPTDSNVSYFLYRLDHTRQIIAADSASDRNYLIRFAQQLKLDFFLSGSLVDSCGKFQGDYFIYSLQNGNFIKKSFSFQTVDGLAGMSAEIARNFLAALPSDKRPKTDQFSHLQISSLQNYFNAHIKLNEQHDQLAEQYLNQAILADSMNVLAWIQLAKCEILAARRDHQSIVSGNEKAQRYLITTQKIDSSWVSIYLYRAEIFILNRKYENAARELFKAYQLDPANPAVLLDLTQLHRSRYSHLGFADEIEIFNQALFLNPGYVEAALALSNHYIEYLQDYVIAIKTIERILRINPNHVPLLMELGRLYIATSQTLKVLKTFEKLFAIDPDNANIYYNLGIFYFNRRDYQNALRLFERAIQLNNHLDAYLYAAYIYEDFGHQETDRIRRKKLLEQAITHLRYRIKNKLGPDDLYAKTARTRLYNIFHRQEYSNLGLK